MTNEFNLSEKCNWEGEEGSLLTEYVKEFIRLLKENEIIFDDEDCYIIKKEDLKKLAGEQLSK